MSNLFTPSKRESAVDLVVNSIKKLLLDRKLKPGDKLPSELEISEGLCVSRGSVREAMKILSAFGLIDIRVGNGTYVCKTVNDDIMDSVLFSFLISNPDIETIYEFRKCIEVDVLELVIKHFDENEKERMELKQNVKELNELMASSGTEELIGENDIYFHYILANATHNDLMEKIYKFIINFMKASIKSTHKRQKGEIAFDIHKEIVEIVESKEMERIHDVIEKSVKSWVILKDPENI